MQMLAAISMAYRAGVAAITICIPFAAVIGLVSGIAEKSPLIAVAMFVAVSMGSMYAGLILVIAYGAPAYAVLLHFNLASYPACLALGLLPGLLLAAFGAVLPFGIWMLLLGPTVALCTHWFTLREIKVGAGAQPPARTDLPNSSGAC